MNKIFLALLITFLPLMNTIEAGLMDTMVTYFQRPAYPQPPKVKVLLMHDKPSVMLEVKGRYKLLDPNTQEHISKRFVGKRHRLEASSEGIKWGEEFPGIHQLLVVPTHPETVTLIDGVEYKGVLYFYAIEGSVSVVNEIFLEDYLDATLTLRYPDPLPEEALAAIAIAERTKTYFEKANPKNKFWDVDAESSGYQGNVIIAQPNGMQQALQETKYMVMSARENEKKFLPYPAEWNQSEVQPPLRKSKVSTEQAVEMAAEGRNAADILSKAFPGMTIRLLQYASPKIAKEPSA